MKICLISKYPPIQGGESSKAYWLAKGLGKIGHKVYVVTNSWEVENDYRERIFSDDIKYLQPKNVKLFSTNSFSPEFFIPYFNPMSLKLISLGLEVFN